MESVTVADHYVCFPLIFSGCSALCSKNLDPLVIPVRTVPAVIDHANHAVFKFQRRNRRLIIIQFFPVSTSHRHHVRINLHDFSTRQKGSHVKIMDRRVNEKPAAFSGILPAWHFRITRGDPDHFQPAKLAAERHAFDLLEIWIESPVKGYHHLYT